MKLIAKFGKSKSLSDRKYPQDGVQMVRVTECSGFRKVEAIYQLDGPIERKI